MCEKQTLIALTGPTAVGKTALSLALAKALDGEIISADSMQVYRHMDIGTAKITAAEMQGVPHHLIDILEPEENFDAMRFQKLAKQAIEEIFKVKVTNVNTLNRQGKTRRTRTGFGRRASQKRAIVTVAEGQTIDIFGN